MYIATVPNRNSPPAILLRESYREGNKVSTKTLANLSHFSPERIEALKLALKGEFDGVSANLNQDTPQVGKTFGTYFALKCIADELGLTKALGKDVSGVLGLFLVLTRVAHRGSRLSAVRFAQQHAVEDILGTPDFDEDDLYKALDYLHDHQESIESKLYQDYLKKNGKPPALVLYDVTSSYFEGEKNELAAYGYNRDGKKGKKQIVIGLLADAEGEPLAVRVFEGNTADPSTVSDQINLLKEQFGIKEVIFVGDRGMVKTKAQEALNQETYHYITALTDAQVRKLLSEGVLQYGLFDEKVCEVETNGKRYILKRNDMVREKEERRLANKLTKLNQLIQKRNEKVQTSKRADPEKGLQNIEKWSQKHRLHSFVSLSLEDSLIVYEIDQAAQEEACLLDGCYVIVTDVAKDVLNTEQVHQAYRQLQKVEHDFRTLKTGFLEVRPIFLRKKERTRAHVLVAMLALKIVRQLRQKLESKGLPWTAHDALDALSRYIFLSYEVEGIKTQVLPQPDEIQSQVFDALGIKLPQRSLSSGDSKKANVGRRKYKKKSS
jgi:transposase